MSRGRSLLVVAGETSGDLYGARLLRELNRLVPDLEPFGLGSEQMMEEGFDSIGDSGEISVVGLVEALRVLPRARQLFHALLEEVDRRGTGTAVLIDFPDFNLRLARRLKRRGVRVVYYISPQLWAWRRRRVRLIARLVDVMLVFFPFELDLYRRHGVEVVHVGHPLVDEVPRLRHVWEEGEPREGPYQVALLPGSRREEVASLLPEMLAAVRGLARGLPVNVVLLRAPSIPRQVIDEEVTLADVPVSVVTRDRFAALADSHLALCASGTATLEVGLIGTPMIVLYRLRFWSYLAARLLVRLPYFSLVNLVLERALVPELLQGAARGDRIAREAGALLRDGERLDEMRRGFAELRGRLGDSGATRRAAREVVARLGREAAA